MSNILDEIIAVTENYRHYNDGLPKQLSSTTNVPISSVQNQSPFPNAFAPSPRGVQDDLVPYSLLHAPNSSHSYYEQDNHSTSFQPSLIEDHSQSNCNPSIPITTSTQVNDVNPTSLTQQHHSNSPHISYQMNIPIISNDQTWSPHQHSHIETNQKQSQTMRPQYSRLHKSSKRSLDQIDIKDEPQTTKKSMTTPTKRVKRDASVVMPPSAKSILERREKAIREGRRKDAKLSETERRILRRLRNRESAERCRQRREEQAKELQERIKTMQLENNRLVEMAGHYKQTIHRLEKMIADFTAKRQHEQKAN